jgi:peptidylprolyl isomerase domain and WD repeat-containing protein 1
LFLIKKNKTVATFLQYSADGSQFVTMATDRQIRIFKFLTGKLYRKYDESIAFINKLQKVSFTGVVKIKCFQDDEAGNILKLDGMEFGRRMTVEKELDTSERVPPSTVIFDETGNFIIYPTMLGIKGISQLFVEKIH